MYLLGPGTVRPIRLFYCSAVLIGALVPMKTVLALADLSNALMALPNLIALVALSGVVAAETKQYFAKQKNF